MFHIIKPDININFVGHRKIWVVFSILTVIASIVLFFTKGLNYGIDFTGGAEIHVQVPVDWDIEKLRSQIEKSEIEDARVQQIGDPSESHYMIKAQGDEETLSLVASRVEAALGEELSPDQFSILKSDLVGPAAGESLRRSGFLSMIYALLAILIYVTLRFDSRYAPGLVVATAHDAIIVIGAFALTGATFDLQILAALLALIGYSNNDTIVVFDRVREVLQLHPKLSIEEAVNRATNDTLSRTVLTSLTTLFVVCSLWVLGGPVLQDFAFALMIGIVVGTYSTIFIANSMVISLTHWHQKRAARIKASGFMNSGAGSSATRGRPQPKYH